MQTGSYLYREGTTPNTKAVVSSKSKLFAVGAATRQMTQVGVMSNFSFSESRGVDPIRGVGYGDQIAEMIPSATQPFEISVERTMLYLANAYQVFGYSAGIDGMVRSLKHHRWPFDVKHELVISELEMNAFPTTDHLGPATLMDASATSYDGSGIYAVVTLFEACWITSYQTAYPAEGNAVSESVSITCTDVLDPNIDGTYGEFLDSGNSPFSTGQVGSQRYL